MSRKSINILGSTGSIGKNTVELIAANHDTYEVRALTANTNVTLLAEQAKLLNAEYAVIADETLYDDLRTALAGSDSQPMAGRSALLEAASMSVDWTMCAIVGATGLEPSLKAVENSKAVALANKECLVAAGNIFMRSIRTHKTTLLPVDSEHNAIFQVYDNNNADHIEKLILTASGGPFLDWPQERIRAATTEEAVAHPNWSMGAKISVDSATLMNKGLEVIEAHYLFDKPADKIDVLVHPQSIIHSMVQYTDGSFLAQMGAPDMRTPIAYCLAWPARMPTTGQVLDIHHLSELTFQSPDKQKFPALKLCYEALQEGQHAMIALNAANEIAVAYFLARKIPFYKITEAVTYILDSCGKTEINDLQAVLDVDYWARHQTKSYLEQEGTKARAVS